MSVSLADLPVAAPPPGTEASIDSEFFLSTFGTDPEARTELVDLFLRVSSQQMQALTDAHVASDWHRIAREAHALKGSLGIFGARPAIRLVEMLEQACEDESIDGIRGFLDQLEGSMVSISIEVEALRPT